MAMDIIGNLGSVTTGIVGFGVILIVLVIVAAFTGIAAYFFIQWKKYQEYKIVIWERDGLGNIRQYSDSAGIFVDKKTNNKRLFLKKSSVGLEPDNVPYVLVANKKTIYLVRRGLKNFQFIKPVIKEDDFHFKVTEEDVNWAINAYERQKKIFQSNAFLQYLPFIMLAFVSIIILVIFIYFFKEFSTLKDVAIAMREAANAMLQVNSGVVLQ